MFRFRQNPVPPNPTNGSPKPSGAGGALFGDRSRSSVMLCVRSKSRRPPSAVRIMYAPMNPPVPRSSAGVARRRSIGAPLGIRRDRAAPGQGVGRRRRSGRLFELGDRPIARVRDGTHDPGRRQRPHAGEGGLEFDSRVADRGMDRLDLFHGQCAVGGREGRDPVGKPLDPVRQVRAGRGRESARVREHDDGVEGAAGEGDRSRKAQDRAPRVAARLVERVLRSAERGGRRSEVARQQQLSGVPRARLGP